MYICDIVNDYCSLEVHECQCGFQIGLDATYIEEISDFKIKCPSCGQTINTWMKSCEH